MTTTGQTPNSEASAGSSVREAAFCDAAAFQLVFLRAPALVPPCSQGSCAPRLSLLCSECSLDSLLLSEREAHSPSGPQGPAESRVPIFIPFGLFLFSLPTTLASWLHLEGSGQIWPQAFARAAPLAWDALPRWPRASPPPPPSLFCRVTFSGRPPWLLYLKCQYPHPSDFS